MKQFYHYKFVFLCIISLFHVNVSYALEGHLDETLGEIEVSETDIRAPRPSLAHNGFVGTWAQLPDLTGLIAKVVHSILASTPSSGSSSSGNVVGPVSSTIDAVPRFANTIGTLLKNSTVLVDDAGNITINGITKSGHTVSWPTVVGAAGTFLGSDGAGNLVYATPVGSGNVSTALPFSTNNALITVDLPSGVDNIKQSNVTLDGSDNISGVNILNANVVNAPTLNGNATSATNFTGPLVGDVTGTQGATVVSFVGGQSAASVASGAVAANAATNADTPNTIVKRDGSGNFNAGTITANLAGNATTATTAITAISTTNFTGPLVGDVTGNQSATVVSTVGGQTAANVAAATTAANAATSNDTPGTIVKRDGSGNFVAGTITANLAGNATTATTATSATTAGSATNFTGPLVGDVTGTQGATVVSTVGGQSAANVASGAVAANAATALDTPNTIVKRDGLGNFAAGTITANLSGNATTATTAVSTTNFTGSLAGDVTGTQAATVVSFVGGQSAANVASGAVAANAATNANTANTIVKRDASGNFNAGTITANLTGNVTGNVIGNATTATTAGSATNFTGSLSGDVTGNQSSTVVSTVGGQTAASVAAATIAANAATSADTPGAIVKRDGSGNFVAGTITASLTGNVTGNLTGNATTATSATTAGSATNFTGPLAGDVTGTQGATVVSFVGGQSAANVAAATTLANTATSADIANTIVKRDASGNFAAGTITANLIGNATTSNTTTTAINFTGPLVGDVTGTQGATVVSFVGGQTAANVASGAAAANAATNANTANTIVKRDASGNFNAGTITASLTGNVTGNLSGNATTATSATTATNFSGSLSGDVTGNQSSTVVNTVGGQTAANIAAATIAANAATSSNSPSTIVKRDASGNFSAGTITANLTGNVTGNLTGNVIGNVTGNLTGNASTATLSVTSTNFTGSLAGDVTGTQGATVVTTVGGQTAASVAAAAVAVAAATNNDTPNTLVLRDGSGNFATNKITIDGTIVNPNDAATKAYVDSVASLGLVAKTPAVVVSTSDIVLSGLQTIDGISLSAGDRVLLVGQTNPVENGLWLDEVAAWMRPTDFATGSTAGSAYVLTLSGVINAGSSWLCSTPTAIVDTDPIEFVEFSLPNQTTGANVGTGAGQIYQSKTGVTLNFKTIAAGAHIVVTNNASDVNIATDGTSANTINTLVARDALGDFSASTITANLTGAASQNVLKAGDTMTGNLNMALQSQVQFQDGSGSGNYVGLDAPATVGASYTVNLPPNAPTAGQVLQATSPSATQWETVGGSPAITETYYVSLSGSDSNDGSFAAPFLTVSHAVNVANGVANLGNPVVINVGAGFFAENNTGGPITISADGISIIGSSISATNIVPFSSAIDLFRITTANVEMRDISLVTPAPGSTANAVTLVAGSSGTARFTAVAVGQFQTGFAISSSSGGPTALFENLQCGGNSIAISINNIQAVINSSAFGGPLATTGIAVNTGVLITGTNAEVAMIGNVFKAFDIAAILVTGGAGLRILSSDIEATTTGIVCEGGSSIGVVGCNFFINNVNSTNIVASGVNSEVTIDGCQFHCTGTNGNPQGTALFATGGATLLAVACSVEHAAVGIQCGISSDTNSTIIQANSTSFSNCITDIQQLGSSTLRFVSGLFDANKLNIANTTNVSFAAFDNNASDSLTIGNNNDMNQLLFQVLNGQATLPSLNYESNYYGNKGTVYVNPNADPTVHAIQAQSNNALSYVVTGDNTKEASINLISDTANFGVSDNIRGWGIDKLGSSANLAFTYTNNDTSGQAARGSNSVMQLDGFNNEVLFPLATNTPLPTNTVAKLVWAGDTDLYRSSANTLATDGNLLVGSLTPAGVVHNDNTGLLSTSLIVNADISASAAITDNKLATISTPGKVANSATTATSANIPNTIVLRDVSGSFTANIITATLVGAASLDVLKSGDTMTGNLNMALQSQVRFQDGTGSGNYVGLDAPATVGTSYTVNLPASAPTAGQVLQATSPSATQWVTSGGSPAVTEKYYVSLSGSDSNDGSFSAPFLTVSHAVSVANSVSSLSNPVAIIVGVGFFAEDNTGGPITITADGISLLGTSAASTSILPISPSTDLFHITTANVEFNSFTLIMPFPGSTAAAVSLSANSNSIANMSSIIISGFQTGFAVNSPSGLASIFFDNIEAAGNTTLVSVNNMQVTIIKNSLIQGAAVIGEPAANTGVILTGTNTKMAILSTAFNLFDTAILVTGGSALRILGSDIEATTNGIICNGGSNVDIVGCNFLLNNANSVNITGSGANSEIIIEGSHFQGTDTSGVPQGIALQVITGASVAVDSCAVEGVVLGIQCGIPSDTITTNLSASGVILQNCITDIQQNGLSTLNFFSGVVDENKITLASPTNVSFAAFNSKAELIIGTGADVAHTVYEILNGQPTEPTLNYSPSYYGNKGTVYVNPNANPTFNATQASSNDANYFVVTGNNAKQASINLLSDTSGLNNGTDIRGWGIDKVGTSANLAFTYTNNDTSGQAARGSNSVMQLDGFNNEVLFPLATNVPLPTNTVAKLIWAGDTDLYRSSANTLATDGNLLVGSLTPAGVVHNDNTGLLSTSLIVNADISASAAITDNKLATISTPGKVANSATTATSANIPNTIVLRDVSGSFTANIITATLVGAASLDVLKSGDTMTGNLNMALQSQVRFQDGTGSGNYVGLNAPATVGTSYTVNLPASAPTAGQVLQATSPSATQWETVGGSPAVTETYYVSLSGSDSNDGSFAAPFRTVSHAVNTANGVASLLHPIVISIGAGIFVENNSGGPITISADGISIVGSSVTGSILVPTTLSNNLFNCTTSNVTFLSVTLDAGAPGSTASGLNMVAGTGQAGFESVIVTGFQTGFSLNGSGTVPIIALSNVIPLGNTTAVSVNNARVIVESSLFLGATSGSTPANTAISVTGTNALVTLLSNSLRLLTTGVSITGGADVRILGTNFETTTTGVICSGGSSTEIVGSNFVINNSNSTNVAASGASTTITIDGCTFDGKDSLGNPQGTAVFATTAASVVVYASTIQNAVIGVECGVSGDTVSTEIRSNSVLRNCTIDFLQNGSSTLRFAGGVFDSNKVIINNPTNVTFSAFDRSAEEALTIGNSSDVDQTLYQVFNGQAQLQNLQYQSDYYGSKGTVYVNPNADPTFNGVQASNNDANYYVVTGNRTNQASINLISDTSGLNNGTDIRGWGIDKVGTSANLAFTYTNNDTSGQAARGSNSVMQLDGFNNEVLFPLATNSPLPTNTVAKLIWAGDTDLYRSSAGVLTTDGNLQVGGLTPAGVVHNDNSGNLTTSLIVNADISASAAITDNKLATISTAGKVANSATTATSSDTPNTIVLRDGSGNFVAGTITANLIGNATSSNTTTTAINFTGPLVGDVTGTQGATVVSFVGGQTAANVAAGSILANAATSANTANAIVKRDASGNFIAGTITANLTGNATTATSATTATTATNFTGPLVGDVTGTQGATVVSSVGGQTAANVAAGSVLANAATSANTANAIVKRDGSGIFQQELLRQI